ncbi:MAG: GTPase ObgE [Actinomycetota bacterium]
MRFVDEAKINVRAGAGGNGVSAWHHEPFKPKGGPDGGDGGDGGSVIMRADGSVGTLLELRDNPQVRGARGGHGEGKRKHGARGRDRIISVPPGTVVYDEDGTLIADLANPGDELRAARGGRGGRGNAHFATATRRAPTFAERGEPGEEARLRLELRLLADVGLVGFPNAGKSTLVARISAARPKIADYPFTTLQPNLGVVRLGEKTFVVADIPGLVAGSSEGKGLGHRFLRHVRRAAFLVFLVDLAAMDRDPLDDVDVLRTELEAFDPELAARPRLVVLSKVDAGGERSDEARRRFPDALAISAVTGEGIDELVRRLATGVDRSRAELEPSVGYVRHIVRGDPLSVRRLNESWIVTSRRVERAVAVTNMDNEESVDRLQKKLISMGVERELERAGAKRGDDVLIGETSFTFEPEGPDGEGDGARHA